ncbi:acyltransferase [Segetibacter koreensis]|uniref:acyltransferase n=1 Tax=Segetibacter koreensis TaxID=398037 RepID=UPI00037B5869|nr:acyltransferase [Segetibacter koreensis]
MHKHLAQNIVENTSGELFIEGDWYPNPLPKNIFLDEMAYPDTSYSFTTFFSEKTVGLSLGYASGNYGHGIFTTGKDGEIKIGKFVVLQCVRLISNLSITIKDHCMFSWGSVITDSWITAETLSPVVRRLMLERVSRSGNRHLEFTDPKPVVIEENVWVGFEAIILPGVTIGRGAVIGSKTIISEDVPPYAVVVGNPGKIVKFLEATDTPESKQKAIKEIIN